MILIPTAIALVLFARCAVLEVRTRVLEHRIDRVTAANDALLHEPAPCDWSWSE